MALDSSLFGGQIAAAAYSVGDIVPMGCIRGPAVVRAGYGAAVLKKVFTVSNTSVAQFKIVVKNSNWVDEMSNPSAVMDATSLDDNSANIQNGHDCDLVPNSSWQVYAVCITAGTETANSMIFALLDIDYPSVSSISNPRKEKGYPVTIDFNNIAIDVTDQTSAPSAIVWATQNVDVFKAGSRYLLDQVSIKSNAGYISFVEISGAAGQNGLVRIIPCRSSSVIGIKYLIDYATPLVKGPMNIAIASIGATPGASMGYLYTDWVKR